MLKIKYFGNHTWIKSNDLRSSTSKSYWYVRYIWLDRLIFYNCEESVENKNIEWITILRNYQYLEWEKRLIFDCKRIKLCCVKYLI